MNTGTQGAQDGPTHAGGISHIAGAIQGAMNHVQRSDISDAARENCLAPLRQALGIALVEFGNRYLATATRGGSRTGAAKTAPGRAANTGGGTGQQQTQKRDRTKPKLTDLFVNALPENGAAIPLNQVKFPRGRTPQPNNFARTVSQLQKSGRIGLSGEGDNRQVWRINAERQEEERRTGTNG
jgi:hypothetical protein